MKKLIEILGLFAMIALNAVLAFIIIILIAYVNKHYDESPTYVCTMAALLIATLIYLNKPES